MASISCNQVYFQTPGPPCFKINGEIKHRIGPLVNSDGYAPKFLQLYFNDRQNE
jgi:hypothetical protein